MVGWIVTAFLLVAAASASLCSRLGDMFGRRRMLLGVLVVAGVGSLVSALATGVVGVILGRAIQGVSGAVLPLCFGLVRENLPRGACRSASAWCRRRPSSRPARRSSSAAC